MMALKPITQSDEINNTVFVGNLAWTTTDQDLALFCGTVGKVVRAEVKRFSDTYRSKGWGTVEFKDANSAIAAVQRLNMTEFNGRVVHVRFDRTAMDETEDPSSVKVFIGNIPWDATDQDLANHFTSCRPRRLRVMTNMSGRSRGFAIFHYDTIAEAEAAIKIMNLSELKGRQIQCRIDRGPGREIVKRPMEGGDGTIPLFVRNLSPICTNETLTTIFSRFGAMASAKVMIHSSGVPKGWGIVSFYNIDDAMRALQNTNGQIVFPGLPPLEVRLDRKSNNR